MSAQCHRKPSWIAADDPDDRLIMQEAFEKNHHPLVFFEDGDQVLQIRNKSSQDDENSDSYPYLMILDLNMPKVSGLELLAFVKPNQKISYRPVLIFSTSRNSLDKYRMKKWMMKIHHQTL